MAYSIRNKNEIVSGRIGVKINDEGRIEQVNYYSNDGDLMNSSYFSAPEILSNAKKYGIDIKDTLGLGSGLEANGIGYKPGELYRGTGSNHGIDFNDLAAGGYGTMYRWDEDPNVSQKGPGAAATLARYQQIARDFGLKPSALTTQGGGGNIVNSNVTALSDGNWSGKYAVDKGGSMSWYATPQEAQSAAQQLGGRFVDLSSKPTTDLRNMNNYSGQLTGAVHQGFGLLDAPRVLSADQKKVIYDAFAQHSNNPALIHQLANANKVTAQEIAEVLGQPLDTVNRYFSQAGLTLGQPANSQSSATGGAATANNSTAANSAATGARTFTDDQVKTAMIQVLGDGANRQAAWQAAQSYGIGADQFNRVYGQVRPNGDRAYSDDEVATAMRSVFADGATPDAARNLAMAGYGIGAEQFNRVLGQVRPANTSNTSGTTTNTGGLLNTNTAANTSSTTANTSTGGATAGAGSNLGLSPTNSPFSPAPGQPPAPQAPNAAANLGMGQPAFQSAANYVMPGQQANPNDAAINRVLGMRPAPWVAPQPRNWWQQGMNRPTGLL